MARYAKFMFRLGHFDDGAWGAHSHPPVFSVEVGSKGDSKVLSVAPGSDPVVLKTLCDSLRSPLFILYVLHTPRGEGLPGRYQSEELTHAELERFLCEFGDLLSSDGRFDLWVHSPADGATVVWDRHNLIHAYGKPVEFVEGLRGLGFSAGTPVVPSPHEHYYRSECDDQARALLASRSWQYTPLREEDEQGR